ncbi:hypothetical protein QBC34DRAFT_155516 [Podospora aff. communis PSN243]|uniref:Uncharacterized protein n=1 Tax=Podospora aff. communis PSN243 TaxID=3040156 RepID=A0AAV9H0V1_9PEZI|nr:hypothetical protein QBC34DRAFT_155516 [Podospora aff. communis PSN243]
METRRTIRDRGFRRRMGKGKGKYKLPPSFFRKKDEEADEPPPPEPPLPPVGKGKGKSLLTLPLFTITLGRPQSTATVTATSTLTVGPTSSTLPVTSETSEITAPPSLSPTATESMIIVPSLSPSQSTVKSVPPGESNAPPEEPQQLGGLSSNQTAGIVVGSIFGFILILVAVFAFIVWRKRRERRRSAISPVGNRSVDTEGSFPDPGPGIHVGKTISVITSPRKAKRKPGLHVPAIPMPAWLSQRRKASPVRAETREFMARNLNEKSAPEPPDPIPPVFQPPRRSVMSAFSWRSLSPPSAPALRGRATPSSDDRPSRAHQRQSSNSDASQWTGAVTQRTDSGIFVPPTALSHPRPGPSGLQTEIPRPSSTRDFAPVPPPKDARRTVRFSGQGIPPTASGRASLISNDSRGRDISTSGSGSSKEGARI